MPRIKPQIRKTVRERAAGRCKYCRSWEAYASQPFEVDHIIPSSRDGLTELENLAYACGGCNGHKHNKVEALDPAENRSAPLFHPRKDNWLDHFSWNDDYSMILGTTPTGRATVEALQLNRPGIINIRNLLRRAGLHP